LPPESDVADVGTAASVRVAVSACVVPAAVGEPVPPGVPAEDVGRAVVTDPAAGEVALPAAPPAVGLLVGAVVDLVVAVVGFDEVDVDVVGFGLEVGFGWGAAGGRVPGGLPAPNAHPSTVPFFGCVDPAPVVLYDQEPPGLARQ
jgi:hypothetical protein